MFSSLKSMTSIQSIGTILSLMGLISCKAVMQANYQDIVNNDVDVIQSKPALEEAVCVERYYFLEQSKFDERIEDLTLSEVMAKVKGGDDRSYVDIQIDNSTIFRKISYFMQSINLDSIPQPSQEEMDMAESIFVNGLTKAGVVVNQFFTEFENSEKTGPFAKQIVEALEALKNEGFVDTVDICEFFKQALFKYLDGTFEFLATLPESAQEYFRSVYAKSLNSASPQVTDDAQVDPELEAYNSYIRSVVFQINSLGPKISNFTVSDMPEIVQSIYEIEKSFRAAVEWRMARNLDSDSPFLCAFPNFSESQKDLLFETQRAAAIALNLIQMVYEFVKAEYIPDYEESLGMYSRLTESLCSRLYSIPFGRDDMMAFNDSHVAQVPAPLAG